MKQKLWNAIERYRTAGGNAEHHAFKADLDALIDEVLAKLAEQEVASLKARLFEAQNAAIELAAEATKWREYKARKDAAIAAGMGRNPLRKEST